MDALLVLGEIDINALSGSAVLGLKLEPDLGQIIAVSCLYFIDEGYFGTIVVEMAAAHPCAERVSQKIIESPVGEDKNALALVVDFAAGINGIDSDDKGLSVI